MGTEEEPLIQMVECRICQEEDNIDNLESPCACTGSLKHAHRVCVQRWCDEKGDVTCEICHEDRRGRKDTWFVDSGCSRHMTGDSKWFTSFTRSIGDVLITFGDNTQGRIEGTRSIRVNDNFILKDVALVDKLSGGWTITGTAFDLRDPRILAMAQSHIMEAEYDDYSATNASTTAFCRSVALVLMALLLLRHALMLTDKDEDDTSTMFSRRRQTC